MQRIFESVFELTPEGARAMTKTTALSFAVYVLSMLPMGLVMLWGERFLNGAAVTPSTYAVSAMVILVVLYFTLFWEYERLFNLVYKESARLRLDLAEHLKTCPLSFFTKHHVSDLSQSMMSDVQVLEHAMSHSVPKVAAFLCFFPLLTVMLLLGNVWLGLAVMLPFLLSVGILLWFKNDQCRVRTAFHTRVRANAEAFQNLIEMHQEIRGFNLTGSTVRRLCEALDETEKAQFSAELGSLKILSASAVLPYVSVGIVLFVGVALWRAEVIPLLFVIGYLLAAIKLTELTGSLSENFLELLFIHPSVQKIAQIRHQPALTGEQPTFKSFDVELHDVSFGFEENDDVLKAVSFTAKNGQVTALVGPSGCGKTTVLKCIARLLECERGTITVGGVSLKTCDPAAFYQQVSMVFQEVTLFNTTVRENIRLGRLEASDAEVEEAARRAHALEFIENLPQGFDTLLGENGAELSGGERQRLSIARAFLKNAPLLFLDEIASNLDVDNERAVQESLTELIHDKTVIVVSHRLKAIEMVDKIVVMNEGRVDAVGKHEELLVTSPLYRSLVEKSVKAEAFFYRSDAPSLGV